MDSVYPFNYLEFEACEHSAILRHDHPNRMILMDPFSRHAWKTSSVLLVWNDFLNRSVVYQCTAAALCWKLWFYSGIPLLCCVFHSSVQKYLLCSPVRPCIERPCSQERESRVHKSTYLVVTYSTIWNILS